MSSLSVQGLCCGYGGRPALTEIDVDVRPGEWLAIIGPNGAGKSTLLKAIAGLIPFRGSVAIDGVSITGLRGRARARLIGYAPQTPAMPDGMTVADYVLLGRSPHLSTLAKEGPADLRITREVLSRLDLRQFADRPLRTLSGGERQRGVLARALAQRSGLLLLDEPTTGLDIGHAQELLELVDALRTADGTTVLSTLHDLTLAAQYADRLLLLDFGTVVGAGPPAEVLTADALDRFYGASTEVLRTAEGHLVIAPTRNGAPSALDADPGGRTDR